MTQWAQTVPETRVVLLAVITGAATPWFPSAMSPMPFLRVDAAGTSFSDFQSPGLCPGRPPSPVNDT